jgi:hypothetical protein
MHEDGNGAERHSGTTTRKICEPCAGKAAQEAPRALPVSHCHRASSRLTLLSLGSPGQIGGKAWPVL